LLTTAPAGQDARAESPLPARASKTAGTLRTDDPIREAIRKTAPRVWGGHPSSGTSPEYDRFVPNRLYFTNSDEANALIASDPLALLVGFVLDQQVPVQKAFAGPLAIRERLGKFDADTLASADLEPVFRTPPAIHRFPGSMARRVQELAAQIRDRYDGDAARIWLDAPDSETLRANLADLPGFGEMKIKALGAVLAKRFDVEVARDLMPWHPTLGDVDSAQALADYQAAKRVHKAEWTRARAAR